MAADNIQVLAMHSTRAGAEQLRKLVAGAPKARLLGMEHSFEDFEQKAMMSQPDILLVEMPDPPGKLVPFLERLRRTVPRGILIATGAGDHPDLILTALRLGAREFLGAESSPEQFNEAVIRLTREARQAGKKPGEIVALWGVKGGVGTSCICLNLAWCLSQNMGKKVAAVDLDMMCGQLDWLADLEPKRDMSDVVAGFDQLDAALMNNILNSAAPGLDILASPADPVSAEDVRSRHVVRVLDHLVDSHEVILLDIPARMDENSLTALDKADKIIMITEPTLPGLRSARRYLSLSMQLGHDEYKLKCVINRDGSKSAVGRSELEKVLGGKAWAYLPNDSKVLLDSVNTGKPAASQYPRSKWCKGVAAVAANLLAGEG